MVALSYAETFHEQMMSDYYMESQDLQDTSKDALERILNTIHAKVCFAEVYFSMLQHQLKLVAARYYLKDSDKTGSGINPDFHTLPIVRDIMNSRRGVKNALESTTKACAALWTRFGIQFLFGNQDFEFSEICNDIRHEVLHLADLLGNVVSYYAWLYGREMNEDAFALADIVCRLFERELDESNVKSPVGYEHLHDSIKMRFISTIRKELVPQLRPRLAERFSIVGPYNLMHGC